MIGVDSKSTCLDMMQCLINIYIKKNVLYPYTLLLLVNKCSSTSLSQTARIDQGLIDA